MLTLLPTLSLIFQRLEREAQSWKWQIQWQQHNHSIITHFNLTNKWQDIRQYLFHLKKSRKLHKSLCFFWAIVETKTGDNSSPCNEWDSSHYSCKRSFTLCFCSQLLGGRKDIKAFSQSWQKNTGKCLDPAVLTRSGTGSVRVPFFLSRALCSQELSSERNLAPSRHF